MPCRWGAQADNLGTDRHHTRAIHRNLWQISMVEAQPNLPMEQHSLLPRLMHPANHMRPSRALRWVICCCRVHCAVFLKRRLCKYQGLLSGAEHSHCNKESHLLLWAVQAVQQSYGNLGQSVQQGYNSGSVQSSQQGYASTSYGSSQQGPTAYMQQQQPQQTQQQQQQPSPYNAQAGYQANQASLPSSGTYGAQQSGAVYGGQAAATPQGYGTQTSQAPYATQQPAYGQQAPRTNLPGTQQSGAMQQPAYGMQGGTRPSNQAPYTGQVATSTCAQSHRHQYSTTAQVHTSDATWLILWGFMPRDKWQAHGRKGAACSTPWLLNCAMATSVLPAWLSGTHAFHAHAVRNGCAVRRKSIR